jgi:hypothetical protein
MANDVTVRVNSFKKSLVDKPDFPDYVIKQFDIVLQKEEEYNKIFFPISKNKEEKRDLAEEEESAVSYAYETITMIFTAYKVKKLDKERNFYFGNQTPITLKSDKDQLKKTILLMLETYNENRDKVITKYKNELQESKELLEKVINNGNVVVQRKLLTNKKNIAKKAFELEYSRLKYLVIATLLGTDVDYRIFFPTTKSKKKTDSSKSENTIVTTN